MKRCIDDAEDFGLRYSLRARPLGWLKRGSPCLAIKGSFESTHRDLSKTKFNKHMITKESPALSLQSKKASSIRCSAERLWLQQMHFAAKQYAY